MVSHATRQSIAALYYRTIMHPLNKHGLASGTQWQALRERLSKPNEQEQEEQEYLAELIEIEFDPEDRRPKSWRPAS